MVDLDNIFAYSRIVAINLHGAAMVIYPKPTSETVRIVQSLLPVIGSLKIVNAVGTTVYEDPHMATRQISVKNLPAGTYLMIITHKDGALQT